MSLFETGELDQSLWAKHLVEAEGDADKAKWKYLKERVGTAPVRRAEQHEAERKATEEAERRRRGEEEAKQVAAEEAARKAAKEVEQKRACMSWTRSLWVGLQTFLYFYRVLVSVLFSSISIPHFFSKRALCIADLMLSLL